MLDANGKFTVLSLSDALTITLGKAKIAGVDVPTGSVEDQINNWLAQTFLEFDSSLYASYVKQFNPTGSDIDIQNPGTPRLQPSVASGYLKLDNSGGASPVPVPVQSSFTAPNGNVYTNGGNFTTVAAHSIGYISVYSQLTGKSQNIPSGQTFSNSLSLVVTNPQPFVDGRDLETDVEYTRRLVYLKTNNTSTQATPAATKELLVYYAAARIYVNNSANDYVTPVPIPTGGYIAVVLLPSGVQAGSQEIQNAINVLVNRFEFGNIIKGSTTTHPVLAGTVYTGTFPQLFSIAPAQSVKVTLHATISVSFPGGTDVTEKGILASAFATQFVQNLISYYGGSAGNYNLTFQSIGSPTPSPVTSTPAVIAQNGIANKIGPVVAVEQIRAFISDEANAASIPDLSYRACNVLSVAFDPQLGGEPIHTLDIAAPSGGTVSVIDFVKDSLFTDGTSWYDRYIFLDPSLITITVNEI